MMSLKGDGKPVSFIEDCAVPLEHLADYTDALTEVFARHGTRGTWYAHASVGTLHVRPILDMRARRRARKMRAIAEEARALVRQLQGRLQRRARRRPVPRRVDRVAVRPEARTTPSARSSSSSTRPTCSTPARSSTRRRWTTRRCSASPAGATARSRSTPVLDWSAWNVQNDPVTERTTRARQRRRHHRRPGQGRRDVQQQRPLPQVRRRHDVPELPRHARRAAPDARPRQHAAAGAVGPARRRRVHGDAVRRGARPVRRLQGLQARLPDRRRHGEDEDRVRRAAASASARRHAARPAGRRGCPTTRALASRFAVAAEPARPAARRCAR